LSSAPTPPQRLPCKHKTPQIIPQRQADYHCHGDHCFFRDKPIFIFKMINLSPGTSHNFHDYKNRQFCKTIYFVDLNCQVTSDLSQKKNSAAKLLAKKSFLWWSSVQTNQLSVGTQRTRNFTLAFQRDDIFTCIWTTSHLYLL
jgi:hypothetical protein